MANWSASKVSFARTAEIHLEHTVVPPTRSLSPIPKANKNHGVGTINQTPVQGRGKSSPIADETLGWNCEQ
jgi:hypothetical protein